MTERTVCWSDPFPASEVAAPTETDCRKLG